MFIFFACYIILNIFATVGWLNFISKHFLHPIGLDAVRFFLPISIALSVGFVILCLLNGNHIISYLTGGMIYLTVGIVLCGQDE